jgi:hypothetical protein
LQKAIKKIRPQTDFKIQEERRKLKTHSVGKKIHLLNVRKFEKPTAGYASAYPPS